MRAKSISEASSKPAAPGQAAAPVPWHPALAIVATFGLFFIGQLAAGLVLGAYGASQGWDSHRLSSWLENSAGGQFSYILLAEGLIVAGLALFLRYYRFSFAGLGLRRPRWLDAGYALAGFAIYFSVYAVLLGLLSALVPSFDANQEQQVGFSNAHGPALVLVFLSLVVLPPLVEETLMRGFLYGSLRKYRGPVMATLLTSVVFALAHLPGGNPGAGPLWVAAVDTFVLSLVLCYLREKTGRLWAGIGIHALKNGIAFTLLFVLHVAR